ncbi:Arylacetamide deacetylase [Handroanthus impetiginosus]|uniref:Arylacetamide deacetylase n=1 Tax=Handroanthus impetiginosus TaxID=429701 RepID=A0A2G9G0J0_9LAMI|nr:Arylacetamide deacetylase [Handroanthus impetiginosus]
MAAMTLDTSLSLQINTQHRVLVEEIDGLIRVYKDGHVERPQIVPCVTSSLAPELGVTCRDMIIDKYSNVWARIYVPNAAADKEKLKILVYFHGGGFCVGSAFWSCYHEFLAKLASKINCAIVSVNYRLAPENPLPAAYDDGVKAVVWLRQQEFAGNNEWWANKCNFSCIFLAGDSAGANIAYNVALRIKPLDIKGLILLQPFFGGETRTDSEKHMAQPPRSALTLAAADTYWRLALPAGANRDHPWCNPVVNVVDLRRLAVMVCMSEMDILKDRNLGFCDRLGSGGVKVEKVVCKGVGHAFQILNKSPLAQTRVHELICHIKNFVSR